MDRIISGTWHCNNCGFTSDGKTWNANLIRTFPGLIHKGAIYLCPDCNSETELGRGPGKKGRTISGTFHCVNCGFTSDGKTWNEKLSRTFPGLLHKGAFYKCPECNEEVELVRGSGDGGRKIIGTWHCLNCGFTTDGKTWNTVINKTFKKFLHKGATYTCPSCKKSSELARGSRTHYDSSAKEQIAKIQPDKELIIFLSHSTRDFEKFKIRKIAERLNNFPDIRDVVFWEADAGQNIIEFMNDVLGKCDVALLFCSPSSLVSEAVKKEWTSVESLNKPIIPIYTSVKHIPPLLAPRHRIVFDPTDFSQFINEVHELIRKIVF